MRVSWYWFLEKEKAKPEENAKRYSKKKKKKEKPKSLKIYLSQVGAFFQNEGNPVKGYREIYLQDV